MIPVHIDPVLAIDRAAIFAVRLLIDAACPGSSFHGGKGRGHGDYVKCAGQAILLMISTQTFDGWLNGPEADCSVSAFWCLERVAVMLRP